MAPSAVYEADPQPDTIGCSTEQLEEVAIDVETTQQKQRQYSQSQVAQLAKQVASMEPLDSSVLRATRACKVLSCGARALHWLNKDLYEHSFSVPVIQDFWSHSWHGSRRLKALLLLLLYNGPPATILATLSAWVMMCLHAAGFLPGFEPGLYEAIRFEAIAFRFLLLLGWRPWLVGWRRHPLSLGDDVLARCRVLAGFRAWTSMEDAQSRLPVRRLEARHYASVCVCCIVLQL